MMRTRIQYVIARCANNRACVYWFVATASLFLSWYRAAARDLINKDGVLYADVASAFLSGGVGAAIDVYHWPFYGILTGLVHMLTGLGIERSADSLNAILLMLACLVFVRIYEEISGAESRIWVAAVLLLSLPILNDYREMSIRGFGFWAFMLLSLFWFIQYSRYPFYKTALKWQLGVAMATLFRVEGIAFIIFAPLYFVFIQESRRQVFMHIFRLNVLFILLAVLGIVTLYFMDALPKSGATEVPMQFSYALPMSLITALNNEAELLYTRMHDLSSVNDARIILISGLLALVFVKVALNIGLPVLAVWVYGVYRRWLLMTRESYIVLYFAIIGLSALVAIIGNHFFLSSRYTVLPVLLCSLISFQYIDYLFRYLASKQLHKWQMAAGVLILALFLDGVISGGASKANIREAAEWVKSGVPAENKMACNERRLEFYSGRKCKWSQIDAANPFDSLVSLKSDGYSYLLLWVSRKDGLLQSVLANDPELELRKEFLSEKGDSVRLYRVYQGGN